MFKVKQVICMVLLAVAFLTSCNTTKYVPEDKYLLNKTNIRVHSRKVEPNQLSQYVKPRPNYKVFGLWRVQLGMYNLSGSDSTSRWNRWLRRMGTPPVLYDEEGTHRSESAMETALTNMGYVHAQVTAETHFKKKKADVVYYVDLNLPYRIRRFSMDISDDSLRLLIGRDTSAVLKRGVLFDSNLIDTYRDRVTSIIRRNGYFRFNKEFIHFEADSSFRTNEVDLKMQILPPKKNTNNMHQEGKEIPHQKYTVENIIFITGYDSQRDNERSFLTDSGIRDMLLRSDNYGGCYFYSLGKESVRRQLLLDNCFFKPHSYYNERLVDQSYTALNKLSIMRSASIRFVEREGAKIDAVVFVSYASSQSISTNLEGTNTAGDFGFAGSINYQHRNIFRGSETFGLKVRGAYELISGNLTDLWSNSFYEVGVEGSLSFPKFLFPFLSRDFKQSMNAYTDVALGYDIQSRPEFQRTVASATYSYKWVKRQKSRYSLDVFDISYVYLPWVSESFKEDFLNDNSYLKYSYENHLILRSGINYTYSNVPMGTKSRNMHTIRVGAESAGNILSLLANTFDFKKQDGYYTFLDRRFEQYVKLSFDFSKIVNFDERNALAFHVGMGVAVPYGNSNIIPFEKRYFSGGANSVRGWSVRSLGPGRYNGGSSRIDYMNQSGDVKLDLNAEYRSRVFWKLQLAAFVDAGNIWTIREYDTQKGGIFKFNSFYKEIAAAYGLGVRLDFDYFLLRLDLGMKAINPEMGQYRWPIIRPNLSRDLAVHFAIGYPF